MIAWLIILTVILLVASAKIIELDNELEKIKKRLNQDK